MDKEKLYKLLIDILIDRGFIINRDDLLMNSTFRDNNIDSLDEVEIIMELEKQLNISIPDDALVNINTPNQLIEYILSEMKYKDLWYKEN